jgi:hypothetical protein
MENHAAMLRNWRDMIRARLRRIRQPAQLFIKNVHICLSFQEVSNLFKFEHSG